MCGLTKLGTNAVTISSKATVKERNNLCIHDTSIWAYTFGHALDNLVHTITVIFLYDRTCTCDLAHVPSKISFGALWLTFSRSHIR